MNTRTILCAVAFDEINSKKSRQYLKTKSPFNHNVNRSLAQLTSIFSIVACFVLLFNTSSFAQSTANYMFSTNATGSLAADMNSNTVDMTTGTTQLVGSGSDQGVSAVTNIGFNFYFYGTLYTQFNVSANGILQLGSTSVNTTTYAASGGSTTAPRFAALASDATTASSADGGGVFSKVVGSGTNRCLVVQWVVYSYWGNTASPATFQIRLYESTGIVEYVYGAMPVGAATYSTNYTTGFSVGTATNQFASVTTSSNTNSTSTFSTNAYTAATNITNLHSTANGSRRVYRYKPPTPVAGPTNLTFASVTTSGMTLNWTAASPTTNTLRYAIYNSTNGGTTYNYVSSVALGTNTYVATGLTISTTYTWKVVALSEGVESASAATASQATSAATTYYWVGATGGTWGTAANWNTLANGTGSTRSTALTTDILIVDGAGTTAGAATTISVDVASFSIGQLKITSNTACTLASSASATTRTITITGNTGDDFVIESGSSLTTNNATNPVAFAFSGTGNTGDISGTYNVGGNTSNVLTTTGGTSTVVTVSSTGIINNTIVGSTGGVLGSVATLIFANGSTYTHSTFTSGGLIPTATWGASSNINMTGASTSSPSITGIAQTPLGNVSFSLPSLTATFSAWTSNTIVIQGNLTVSTATSIVFRAVTSGTLTVNGNFTINGGTFQHTSGAGTMVVLGNTTIASGATLDLSAGTGGFSQRGATFTNNGTLTGSGTTSASAIAFFSPSNIAMTLAGTGTVSNALSALSVQTTGGLTITHTNQIPVLRTNLFYGAVTNSNKITMGTGAALAVTFQTGSAGNTQVGGTFDVSPTWNLGTGTYAVLYSQEFGGRTTGYEIPPTRSISSLSLTNSNGLTVSGGTLSTAALTFNASCGNLTTSSANVLRITGTANTAITRTNSTAYVNGPLELTLPASLTGSSIYYFPVGKTALIPFELTSPITTAGGTVIVRAEVFDGNCGGTPGNVMGTLSTSRYWAASIVSGAANYTSSHIRLTDASTTGLDAIAASTSQTGAYNLQGGVVASVSSTTILTTTPVPTSIVGYYVMGTKGSVTLSNVAITPTGNQCANATRTVTVTATPGGAAVTGVVINYAINGVSQTAVAMTNTSGNDWSGTIPTVTPSNATVTWSVTATDANAVTKTSTAATYQDNPNLGVVATASANPSSLCAGSNTSLTLSLSKALTAALGAGASTSSSAGVSMFSGGWGGSKTQYLIRASELTALGLSAGAITSIGFEPTTSGQTYTGFSLSIGASSLTNLSGVTSFATGLTQVYAGTSGANNGLVLTANTLNTLTFGTGSGSASSFTWDGTSNIILSFSWSSVPSAGSSTSTTVKSDSPGFVCSAYRLADSETPATMLASTTVGSTGSSRPKFTFAGNSTPTPTSYSWSDGTTTVGTSNPQTASVSGNTTYTGSAVVNGCTLTAQTSVSTDITALSLTSFSASATSYCAGGSSTLSGAFTGGCPPYNVVVKDGSGATVYSASNTLNLNFSQAVNPSATTTYTLTVTDASSTSVTANASVTVNPLPTVAITSTNTNVCGTTPATLTASGGAAYVWTVDGSTAVTGLFTNATATTAATTSTNNTATIYAKPTASTTYKVVATDANGCANSTTKTVNIYTNLEATATSDASLLCAGSSAQLTATASMTLGYAASSTAYAPIASPSTGVTTLISGGTTSVAFSSGDTDDGYWNSIALPFTLSFNGTNYTTVGIQTNGIIGLGSLGTTSGYANTLPSTAAASPSSPTFAAFYADLSVASGTVSYFTTGTAPNRKFVVNYTNVPFYLIGGSVNVQAIINEDGSFESHIGTITQGTSSKNTSVALIQSGTVAYVAAGRNNVASAVFTANEAWKIAFTTPNFTYAWDTPATNTLSSTTVSNPTISSFSGTETFTVNVTETNTSCVKTASTSISLSNVALSLTSITPSESSVCANTSVTMTPVSSGGCGPFTYEWTANGNVVGSSTTLTLTPSATTTYTLKITDVNSNTATSSVTITVNNPTPTVTNLSKCASSSTFALSASPSNAANALNWYTAATGGTLLAAGTSYTTPTISTIGTTTYYVEEREQSTGTAYSAAKPSPTNASNNYWDNYGLVFNASSNVVLTSVQVYASSTSTSTMTIRLLNSSGTQVVGTSDVVFDPVDGTGTTATTVNLNYYVPAGNGYRLVISSGMLSSNRLIQETSGISYPYTNGAISITAGATGTSSTNSSRYYWFYNMQVASVCAGERVPVTATLTAPPAITASATSSTICNGTSTTLSVSSSNTNYTYAWDNSLGAVSSASVSPTANTTYTVTATDASSGCSSSASVSIAVNPSPVVTAAASSTTLCAGNSTSLSATVTTNDYTYSYSKGFESGNLPSGWTTINAGYSYYDWTTSTTAAHTGSYSMAYLYDDIYYEAANNWALTNAQSLIAGKTYTIKFWYKTSSGAIYPEKLKVTIGNAATVAAQTTTLWDNNGGTNLTNTTWEEATITYTPTTSGNYYVGFHCFSDADMDALYVDDVSITYSAAATYSWTSTNGYTSSVQNPGAVTPTASDTYTLSVTNNYNCTKTSSIAVTVNPLPTASIASTNTPLCSGSTANFNLTGTAGAVVTYSLNGGANQTVTLTGGSATVAVANATSNQAIALVSVTSASNCTVSLSETSSITVNALPSLTVAFSPSNTICEGESITLTASGASTYSWTGSITNGTAFSPSTSGSYTVTGTSSAGCTATASASVTVNETVDWANIQNPSSAAIDCGSTADIYGKVYDAALTSAAGANNTITVEIGVSSANTDPSTWASTAWSSTTFNVQSGNDDEYKATLGSGLAIGTYYYAFRSKIGTASCYKYGGTGGLWNGTTSTNGVLTISGLDWANVQYPSTGTLCMGESLAVYGQVYKAGITNGAGATSGMVAEIGVSTTNTNPATWGTSAWSAATFNAQAGNNDEYKASIGNNLLGGTYYYAFRYKLTNSCDYQYGGTNGFWDGTTNVNGVLTINGGTTATIGSGDYIWKGNQSSDWSTTTNWMVLNGTTFEDVNTLPSSSINVIIRSDGTCVSNQPVQLSGNGNAKNVTIEANATLTLGNSAFNIAGNIVNNGTLNAGNSQVNLVGTTQQSIGGANSITLDKLTINNSAGISLSNELIISTELNMTQGNVLTSSTNILTIGANSTATLNWTAGTIVGPMKRWMAATSNSDDASSIFPVGSASNNRWAKLNYTTAPTSAGYLKAEFKTSNPASATTTPYGSPYLVDQYNWVLDNMTSLGYWEINPASSNGVSGGTYDLSLRANNFTDVFQYDVTRLVKSPNPHTSWQLQGTHGTITGGQTDFTISRVGLSDFSFFTLAFPTASPLPVELVSLQANCGKSSTIDVTWVTASEHNSSYYLVEKSQNGIDWVTLGTQTAAGNSTQLISYSMKDLTAKSGTTYYRLTQFDVDGQYKTYDIVSANCENENDAMHIYPNPTDGTFTIEYTTDQSSNDAQLEIVDSRGSVVVTRPIVLVKGTNLLMIEQLKVAPGIYYVQLKNNGTNFISSKVSIR